MAKDRSATESGGGVGLDPKYTDWMLVNISRDPLEVRGWCGSWTIRMVSVFPELRRVRGHYSISSRHRAEHWWCETAEGEIVDPTVHQFASVDGTYEEHSGPEPIGECYSCGSYVWKPTPGYGSSVCSVECGKEYDAYLREEGSGNY